MDDWGTALVGLGGALVGAFVGFTAVIWQHSAQKTYELRQRAAKLITLGEEIRDEFDSKNANGMLVSDIPKFNLSLEEKERAMTLILRMLELTAPRRSYRAAIAYGLSTFEFVSLGRNRFSAGSKPSPSRIQDAQIEWQVSRDAFIAHLQGWQRDPVGYVRSWGVERRLRKRNKLVAAEITRSLSEKKHTADG